MRLIIADEIVRYPKEHNYGPRYGAQTWTKDTLNVKGECAIKQILDKIQNIRVLRRSQRKADSCQLTDTNNKHKQSNPNAAQRTTQMTPVVANTELVGGS